jgi:hypothetical protein
MNAFMTKNTILEQEMKTLTAVVAARKERQSGKRSIIKDKHILNGRELLDSILEAEKETKEKGQKSTKRTSKRAAGDISALINDELPEGMDIVDAIRV